MLVPYDKLNETPRSNSLDVVAIAGAARDAYCSLNNATRDLLGISELPVVGRGFLGDLYRTICPNNVTPDRSIPPSRNTGGQCPGQLYTVTFKLKEYFSGDSLETRDTQLLGLNVVAPIVSITVRDAGQYHASNIDQYGAGFNKASILCHGTSVSEPTPAPVWVDVVTNNVFQFQSMFGVSVAPQPGATDSCGIAPTINPPPVYLPPSIPVPFSDGTRNLPWKIPPILIPPDISFEPKLVIQVDDLNIIFDFSGAEINLNLEGSLNFPIGTGSGGTNPDGDKVPDALNDSIFNLNSRLKKLQKDLDALTECVCPEPASLQTNFVYNAQGGEHILSPAGNRFCALRLTQMPSNRKEQIGKNSANVLYCGWAWFGSDAGYLSERMPVDSEGKVFENKGHFDRFSFSLYDGYKADLFELNSPPPEPIE